MNKILIFVLIFFLIAVSFVCSAIASSIFSYCKGEDKCSDKIIKEHILSLSKVYSEAEKDLMVPQIKKDLIERGMC